MDRSAVPWLLAAMAGALPLAIRWLLRRGLISVRAALVTVFGGLWVFVVAVVLVQSPPSWLLLLVMALIAAVARFMYWAVRPLTDEVVHEWDLERAKRETPPRT